MAERPATLADTMLRLSGTSSMAAFSHKPRSRNTDSAPERSGRQRHAQRQFGRRGSSAQTLGLTGEDQYRQCAARVLRKLGPVVEKHPYGFARLLGALDFYLATPKEIALIGDLNSEAGKALLQTVYATYLPNKIVVAGSGKETTAVFPCSKTVPNATASRPRTSAKTSPAKRPSPRQRS